MSSFGPLMIGQQVEIEFFTGEITRYRSKVENISEKVLEILSPMHAGQIVRMPVGLAVKVSYFDELAIHSFVSTVVRQTQSEFSTVFFRPPAGVIRTQRRDYVRIETSLEIIARKKLDPNEKAQTEPNIDATINGTDIHETEKEGAAEKLTVTSRIRDKFLKRDYSPLFVPTKNIDSVQTNQNAEDNSSDNSDQNAEDNSDDNSEEQSSDDLVLTIPGTTIDLSGGGLMFRCNEVVKMGDLLEIEVFLGEDDSVKAAGNVVRFIKMPAHTKYQYAVGIKFTEITEKERDKIIKYIFKKQLEFRKKGLL